MLELARGNLFPVLPLRDIVVFPHMIVPLFVGRDKSVRALEDVMKDDKQILLVTQKNAAQDDPTPADRSEEHTSELQSLMRISYAVFCLKKKKSTTFLYNNDTQTSNNDITETIISTT